MFADFFTFSVFFVCGLIARNNIQYVYTAGVYYLLTSVFDQYTTFFTTVFYLLTFIYVYLVYRRLLQTTNVFDQLVQIARQIEQSNFKNVKENINLDNESLDIIKNVRLQRTKHNVNRVI